VVVVVYIKRLNKCYHVYYKQTYIIYFIENQFNSLNMVLKVSKHIVIHLHRSRIQKQNKKETKDCVEANGREDEISFSCLFNQNDRSSRFAAR